MKKKSMIIGIKGESESFQEVGSARAAQPESSIAHEKDIRPGRIISRLDHPVTIGYNGESVVIPPKGNVEIADIKKVGALPRGVVSLSKD